MSKRLHVIVAATLLSAPLSLAQTPRVLTLDDISQHRTVSDPQISPDGTQVLYVTSTRDLKENVQNTDIWNVISRSEYAFFCAGTSRQLSG